MANVLNRKLIKKVIEANINLSNADIAKLLQENYKDFEDKTVENLRKRVGEVRNEHKLQPEVKDEHVPIVRVKAKEKDSDIEMDQSEWAQKESKFLKMKEKLTKSERKIKLLTDELSSAHSELDVALEFKQTKPTSHKIKAEKSNSDSEATACIILGDWHVEERVDADTVNGLNSYTPDDARLRADNAFRRGVRLFKIFKKDITINNLLIAFLGDMITGYIHEELMESNFMSPIEASMFCEELIISGLDYVLNETDCNLTIPCKPGNHGRTTLKRRVSTYSKNSYEIYMYNNIARHYQNNDRVNFIIENGYLTYVDVYDYTIRFHHGDNLRYWGGIGGITTPATKAISSWDKERPAYLDVFGHFHTQMLDTGTHKFVSNGSLIGYNPFAVSIKASYEVPKQSFFLIDKHRGKTVSAPIFVL